MESIEKACQLCVCRCIIRLSYKVIHFVYFGVQTYYTLKGTHTAFLLKSCKVMYYNKNEVHDTFVPSINYLTFSPKAYPH